MFTILNEEDYNLKLIMDFHKRFIGRESYIDKTGNIIDHNKNEVTPLPRNQNTIS